MNDMGSTSNRFTTRKPQERETCNFCSITKRQTFFESHCISVVRKHYCMNILRRMIKVDEDENAICCRNEGNRTSLSIARICMQIRDGSYWVAKLLQRAKSTRVPGVVGESAAGDSRRSLARGYVSHRSRTTDIPLLVSPLFEGGRRVHSFRSRCVLRSKSRDILDTLLDTETNDFEIILIVRLEIRLEKINILVLNRNESFKVFFNFVGACYLVSSTLEIKRQRGKRKGEGRGRDACVSLRRS